MERRIFITDDGSPSIRVRDNVTYHSRYGALRESMHVFIEAGFRPLIGKHNVLRIFEMGLGTGLNAYLTAMEASNHRQKVEYTAVEMFPLESEEVDELVAAAIFDQRDRGLIKAIHSSRGNEHQEINPYFSLRKRQEDLLQYNFQEAIHLVYFDAFDPMEQPELWTTAIFEKLGAAMVSGGVLVTYCCKGQVRRNMLAAGFQVEKIPGPPGKREMIRARKV